ncbi:MAG: hypothetical protein AAGC93_21015 [Cyanobacteria bacterium P01_F01_bin.53]
MFPTLFGGLKYLGELREIGWRRRKGLKLIGDDGDRPLEAIARWKGQSLSLPECGESVTRFLTTPRDVRINWDTLPNKAKIRRKETLHTLFHNLNISLSRGGRGW